MEYSTEHEFLQPILEKGFDGMAEVLQNFFNLAMKIEREKHLHAGAYQRTTERVDYANGFKPRTIQTLAGELNLSIPQTRNSDFYPECLERGMRSVRALRIAMAEMYIHGVATRKVRDILEKTCGLEVSAMQVSRANLGSQKTRFTSGVDDSGSENLQKIRYVAFISVPLRGTNGIFSASKRL